MSKVISFFKDSSSLKLIAISIVIAVLSYFLEKPLPSIITLKDNKVYTHYHSFMPGVHLLPK